MPILYLKDQSLTLSNVEIAVDTNILIMLFDRHHPKHSHLKRTINRFIGTECKFTYFVATKLELYHYFSTRLFARFMKQYEGHLLQKVDSLRETISEIDFNYISQENIKAIREDILAIEQGHKYWKELLNKAMKKVEENLKEIGSSSSFTYKTKAQLTLSTEPSWQDAENMITKQLMGSNDAAIFNLFECSNIDYFMTGDGDFEYLFKYKEIENKTLLKY